MVRRIVWSDHLAVIRAIEEDGAVILTDFTSEDEVRQVNQDADPVIQRVLEERSKAGIPPGTARCYHLWGYSPTAREIWLQRDPVQKVLNHFVGTTCSSYNDDSDDLLSTGPLLSTAATLCIGPGQEKQTLHRDDFLWQQVHPEVHEFVRGRDMGIGMLVAGCKTTAANGATLIIPGSHLWGHERRPVPGEIVTAELNVGEALCYLSSTVHAGGANTTQDEFRWVHGFFFCRAYLKPEDNQHVFWTREEVKTWSPAAQKQAGYIIDHPWLGHCEEKNPIDVFRASNASKAY